MGENIQTFKFVIENYTLKYILLHNDNQGVTKFNSNIYTMITTSEEQARLQFGVTGICSSDDEWLLFEEMLAGAKGE